MLNALSNMVAMRRRESAQGELEIRVGSVPSFEFEIFYSIIPYLCSVPIVTL